MRAKIVLGLILGLFVAFGVMAIARGRSPHVTPAAPKETTAVASSASASASSSASSLASASAPRGSASADAPDAGSDKLFDRPLRVIALGWELAAAGLLANGGASVATAPTSDFTAAGVQVDVAVTDTMSVVEGALARGGADKDGADIAVVPLSSFVASYERLRALAPEAFFVTGLSRGREVLFSTKDAVPSAADKPDAKTGHAMVGAIGDPATFLGLFVLDASGVPPSSVRLFTLVGHESEPPLAAFDKDAAPADSPRRRILLSTADATRLSPFVAVAPHGLLDKHPKAITAWAKIWLEGTRKLESDAPGGARKIASIQGAPEPLALLRRLGVVSHASLNDNARMMGMSGRGALTLEALFQRAWAIWRDAGALTTPVPDPVPVHASIIATLARAFPSLLTPGAPPKGAQPSGSPSPKAQSGPERVLFVMRQPEGKLDEGALLATAGFFADAFDRSALRVAIVKNGGVDAALSKRLADDVTARFDLGAGRVTPAKKAPAGAAGIIEVMAAP